MVNRKWLLAILILIALLVQLASVYSRPTTRICGIALGDRKNSVEKLLGQASYDRRLEYNTREGILKVGFDESRCVDYIEVAPLGARHLSVQVEIDEIIHIRYGDVAVDQLGQPDSIGAGVPSEEWLFYRKRKLIVVRVLGKVRYLKLDGRKQGPFGSDASAP